MLAAVAFSVVFPLKASASPDTHGRPRPLGEVYRTHQGWEYRTDHFIAVATTSGDDARWAGEELESAWQETARLADHFGDNHRRPDFGLVGAIVTGKPTVQRPTGTRYPKLLLPANPMVVEVKLEHTREDSRANARQSLRRKGAATLLRQAGYDEKLPRWATVGLTEFVADEPWDRERFAQERRAAEQRGQALPELGVVFRHLMTADDGAQAAPILESLQQWIPPQPPKNSEARLGDFSAGRLQRRVPIHTRWDKVTARRADTQVAEELPRLPNVSAADLEQRVSRWLIDPQMASIPVSLGIAENDPAYRRAAEMALLMKLWQRMEGEASPSTGSPKPIDLERLYSRLMSNKNPAWSVIDVDGRLLTSRDQARVDELFADRREGYRAAIRDGHAVLHFREPEGSMLEAAIERGTEPSRPVIRVQRIKARGF